MSQAEELLQGLSAGATTFADDVDYVSIENRYLIVPAHLQKLGVAHDHAVNTVHFVGPRYSENGTDLSKMNIWINYRRSEDEYEDKFLCTNVKVDSGDDTLLHYDWLITRNVTEVHGNVTVIVCAKDVDGAGNEDEHWNTEMYTDFYVSEGMEVDGDGIINQQPDLVDSMLDRINTVENKTTTASMLGYVDRYLDENPAVITDHIEDIVAEQPIQEFVEGYLDDYVDIGTTEDRTLVGSVAGAYEMVAMAGASEQKTMEGKNLYNKVTSVDGYGIGNTGDVYVDSTASASDYIEVDSGASYSITNVEWAQWYDENKNYIRIGTGKVMVAPSNARYARLTVRIANKDTAQFEPGEIATPYEPYCGGTASPNPDYPQEVESTGECVEMIQGGFANGAYTYSTVSVCNKNKIPCKSGDVVKVITEKAYNIAIFWFNDNGGVISYNSLSNVQYNEVTIPSGGAYWAFHIQHANGLTPQTVGKITLTINGEYVVPVKLVGKNLLDCGVINTHTSNGVTVTPSYNSNGELECMTVNGTTTSTYTRLLNIILLPKGKYILNGCPTGGSSNTYRLLVDGVGVSGADYGGTKILDLTNDTLVYIYLKINSGATMNNAKFYPMLRKADIEDATYSPYHESTAYITLPEPLRGIGDVRDVIEKRNGKWGVERKIARVVFDGRENWYKYNHGGNDHCHYAVLPNVKPGTRQSICSHFGYIHYVWDLQDIGYADHGSLPNAYFSTEFTTVDEWKAWLTSNPVTYDYVLDIPTWIELDEASQIALDNLQAYDGATHVMVDAKVQPIVTSKYGTSEVGGRAMTNTNRIEKVEEGKADKTALAAVDERVVALEEPIVESEAYEIRGCAPGGYRLLEMDGNTEQKKLSGRQLYNVNDIAVKSTVAPTTIDKEGWVTITYDNSASSTNAFCNFFSGLMRGLKNNTLYTIVTEVKELTNATFTLNGNNASYPPQFAASKNVTAVGTSIVALTSKDSFEGCASGLRSFVSVNAGTVGKAVFRISVLEDTTVTAENFVYEPYIGGVELRQGAYLYNTGAYSAIKNGVCNQNPIPCKAGDVIKLKTTAARNQVIVFMNNGTYVSYLNATGVAEKEYTVPNNSTHFLLTISDGNLAELTPESVGKVSFTVNGKPIYIRNGVKIVNGGYGNTGNYSASHKNFLCNQTAIPCKTGDKVKIVSGDANTNIIAILWYNDSGYTSMISNTGKEHEVTVPSGVTKFCYNIGYNAAPNLETVGTISLAVNDVPINVITKEVRMTSPSPYYPQAMYSTGDCVEMIQGGYQNGSINPSMTTSVACKNKIPCKSGDVVKIDIEKSCTIAVLWFDENKNSMDYKGEIGSSASVTIPSGGAYFAFHIQHSDGITPDTVGKITLTINGKYLGCVKTLSENQFNGITEVGQYNNGTWEYLSTRITTDYIQLKHKRVKMLLKDVYTNFAILNVNYFDKNKVWLGNRGTLGLSAFGYYTREITIDFPSNAEYVKVTCCSYGTGTVSLTNYTLSNEDLQVSYIKETYFLTNEPLRKGDILFKDSDGLWKVERKQSVVNAKDLVWAKATDSQQTSNTNMFMSAIADKKTGYNDVMSNRFPCKIIYSMDVVGVNGNSSNNTVYIRIDNQMTADEFNTWLTENDTEIMYPLATPIIEVLDPASQRALNSLETFNGVTYLEVDSRTQPLCIKGEYGTTKLAGDGLKALLNSETAKVVADTKVTTYTAVAKYNSATSLAATIDISELGFGNANEYDAMVCMIGSVGKTGEAYCAKIRTAEAKSVTINIVGTNFSTDATQSVVLWITRK